MTSAIPLTEQETELIEQLSTSVQMRGLTPAASKVLALLTVSPVVELTFEQIMHTVGIGKSATSTALTQLQSTRHIEFYNKLGERKRYFRLRIEDTERSMHDLAELIQRSIHLYEKIIKIRPKETAAFNKALLDKVAGLQFMHSLLIKGTASFKSKKKEI